MVGGSLVRFLSPAQSRQRKEQRAGHQRQGLVGLRHQYHLLIAVPDPVPSVVCCEDELNVAICEARHTASPQQQRSHSSRSVPRSANYLQFSVSFGFVLE